MRGTFKRDREWVCGRTSVSRRYLKSPIHVSHNSVEAQSENGHRILLYAPYTFLLESYKHILHDHNDDVHAPEAYTYSAD